MTDETLYCWFDKTIADLLHAVMTRREGKAVEQTSSGQSVTKKYMILTLLRRSQQTFV